MKDLTINSENLKTVHWSEECFKFCYFSNIELTGEHVDSDFIDCTFEKLDSYWGFYNLANFIDCIFIDCTFHGCSFPDVKFVHCKFQNCQFLKDNMGGDCSFERTQFINCENAPEVNRSEPKL